MELQHSAHRPTAQETWRRDWPKRRSRDCNVTSSKENSLKKLTHYGDRDDTPLRLTCQCPRLAPTASAGGERGLRAAGFPHLPHCVAASVRLVPGSVRCSDGVRRADTLDVMNIVVRHGQRSWKPGHHTESSGFPGHPF